MKVDVTFDETDCSFVPQFSESGRGIPGTGKNAEVFNGGAAENASGEEAHVEGHNTKSFYARGHAQNDRTEAGWRSHAEGFYSHADDTSHAGGRFGRATGVAAFAHGLELSEQPTISGKKLATTDKLTMHSTEIPVNVSVIGTIEVGDFICINFPNGNSTDCRKVAAISADGKTITLDQPYYEPLQPAYNNQGIDQDSLIFPVGTAVRLADLCEATGNGAVSVGCATKATGARSFAHGEKSIASGDFSEAGGKGCEASGNRARASGTNSKASGANSVAEGDTATASGTCAVANGRNTVASGDYSKADGFKCEASGTCSSASGNQTKATGNGAVATGSRTVANSNYQTVSGISNIPDTPNENGNGKYAEIVGNGSSGNESNARTTDWSGNGWFAGDVYVGGTGQDDPNAEKLVKASELKKKFVATGTPDATTLNQINLSSAITKAKTYQITFTLNASSYVAYFDLGSSSGSPVTTGIVISSGTQIIHGFGVLSSNKIKFTFNNLSSQVQESIVPKMTNFKVYALPY